MNQDSTLGGKLTEAMEFKIHCEFTLAKLLLFWRWYTTAFNSSIFASKVSRTPSWCFVVAFVAFAANADLELASMVILV